MKGLIITFFLIFGHRVLAQDERFVRKMLSGDFAPNNEKAVQGKKHFKAVSSFHEIDLDGDDRVESIVIEKRDSEDWLHIHNYAKEKIYSLKFVRKGWQSDVYKINMREISKDSRVLLVHYYEGHNQGENFSGTARLYVISWDKSDLKTLTAARGPLLWDEFADSKIHYHQRPMHVSLFDFDSDGIREIAVRHHLSSKVMKYSGNGKWATY